MAALAPEMMSRPPRRTVRPEIVNMGRRIEHRAKKWEPVFCKKRCDNKKGRVGRDSQIPVKDLTARA
jgi:hypothetical protein